MNHTGPAGSPAVLDLPPVGVPPSLLVMRIVDARFEARSLREPALDSPARTMGPHLVVARPPALDDGPGLQQRMEDFPTKHVISQCAIQALDVAISESNFYIVAGSARLRLMVPNVKAHWWGWSAAESPASAVPCWPVL